MGPLVTAFPELAVFAITYATSCWSDPSTPTPSRSLTACRRHRVAEIATLQPTTIVAVGDAACQQTLGVGIAAAAGQLWQHESGAYVVPVREGQIQEGDATLLRTALDRHGLGYYDLS